MSDRQRFPFGVYNVHHCAMTYIGLHENADDVWHIWLGWPDKAEIEDAKSRGFRVIPLTCTYDPPV
jgi:hypothetical protein